MCKKLFYFACILFVLSLASNSMADLVAYYSMDEGEGEIVADGSGNGHDGTISGSPTWVEGAPGFGTAVLFGAQGSMPIDCGMWDNTSGTGEMTVGCWVKFSTGGTDYQGIVSNRTGYAADQMYWALEIMGDSGSYYFGSLNGSAYNLATAPQDQWAHIAVTFDGQTVVAYLNGVEEGSGSPAYGNTPESTIRIGSSEATSNIFEGAIDEVYFFNTLLSLDEIVQLMNGEMKPSELNPGGAKMPEPEDQSTDILRDVVFSWEPGKFANTHNLFLGTEFSDVNDADETSQLLVGPSLSTNSYASRLEFGQTYFWRVDEVNAPPDNTVYKGNVWSFTVEPFAYPIPAANIIPTASGQSAGQGPEKTIDSSGLDANDLHSVTSTDMWLSTGGEPGSAWIQYEFVKPYKLHEMLVWNYNGDTILSLYGLKEVTVEYSTDAANWTQLTTVSEFAQATGSEGYASNTTVPFEGAAAKYVRITANGNHGGGAGFFNKYGLSEVRFTYIPVNARMPGPESGTTEVAIDTALSWRPGREAAEHNVLLSTDEQAVIDGTAAAVTVGQPEHSPDLALSSTYYWRIDEVNNAESPSKWESDIWNFSTQEYIVVDDFESYNDILEGQEGSNLVYITWEDGYANPATNGSTMGYVTGASMETNVVYGGDQSAPLLYNNTGASLSEVTVDPGNLPIGRNWSKGSPQALVLWIHGDLGNTGNDRLYVKVGNSKFPYDGDIARPQWKPVVVDLTGVNLNNVSSLTIGVERSGGAGGSGLVFLDEIMLYGTAPAGPAEEIWIEAEAADSIELPMMIYDDPNASGGKYIMKDPEIDPSYASPPADGLVTYQFTVAGGTYTVAGRVITDGMNDGLWFRIPNATMNVDGDPSNPGWIEWNGMTPEDIWGWEDVFSSNNDDVTVEFTLDAGTYTIEIRYRDDATQLDALVITKID